MGGLFVACLICDVYRDPSLCPQSARGLVDAISDDGCLYMTKNHHSEQKFIFLVAHDLKTLYFTSNGLSLQQF